tara:strand:- start:884 stop:1363 length:480 start_codon:yes stop_codon:yes gene_type:complete
MNKKILFIDMDGVMVDFGTHIKSWFDSHQHLIEKFKTCPDHIPGIFRDPLPMDGAIDAINKLYNSGKYDMYIATSAPWGNPSSLTDKRYWIEKYFGEMFHKRLITTHRKDMLIGDYLIDDRTKNGAGEFNGTLLKFGTNWETNTANDYPNWDSILEKLL